MVGFAKITAVGLEWGEDVGLVKKLRMKLDCWELCVRIGEIY